MRPDNIRPAIRFVGDRMFLKFKYPPTQEEFNLAMALIAEAMASANKATNQDIHIVSWSAGKNRDS